MFNLEGQREAIRIADNRLSEEDGRLFIKGLMEHFENLLETSEFQVRQYFTQVFLGAKAHAIQQDKQMKAEEND